MRFGFRHSLLRRLLRLAALCLALLALCVTILTFLYSFHFIHPVSTLMLRDKLAHTDYKRKWIPLKSIAPSLINSVITAEDTRFCHHSGVDWQALRKAAQTAIAEDDEKPRGASTIAMQLVKNLFFWTNRSYLRKAAEIPLALWVSLLLPKKRIMEIYLNIAQWGKGIYGAEAAARHYFHVSARDLTPEQSALLAISLPSPLKRNPLHLSNASIWRAFVVESRQANIAPAQIRCLR